MTRQKIWWKAYFAVLEGCSNLPESERKCDEFANRYVDFAEKCADLTIDRFTNESGFVFAPLGKCKLESDK